MSANSIYHTHTCDNIIFDTSKPVTKESSFKSVSEIKRGKKIRTISSAYL